MVKKQVEDKVYWYVKLFFNGNSKTYYFDSDKTRNWMFDFLTDKILRNQRTIIVDSKKEETILLNTLYVVSMGKKIQNSYKLMDLVTINPYKKDDLLLRVEGARY